MYRIYRKVSVLYDWAKLLTFRKLSTPSPLVEWNLQNEKPVQWNVFCTTIYNTKNLTAYKVTFSNENLTGFALKLIEGLLRMERCTKPGRKKAGDEMKGTNMFNFSSKWRTIETID